MNKLKVAVIFGGCSEEHNVSIKSAREIAANIDSEKYEPVYIGITKSGVWKMCGKPTADWATGDCTPVIISPDKQTHGLILTNKRGQEQRIDVVFPVLHGKSGEDGSIQGLLELSGIPYVGCDIQSSALCMDKSLAYIVVKNAGIAVPQFWVWNDDQPPAKDAFSYPIFVKPARSGSSFGVAKVNSADELDAALASARRFDCKVLIEQAILGIEAGCAVLGNGSDLIVGEVDQIKLSHGIFHIHQEAAPEKGSENSRIIVPADLPIDERRRIKDAAKTIYQALGCRGLARVDLFLETGGRIVLNEVNTLPGFTTYSRYPRMMAAAGITLSEIIDRLIALALIKPSLNGR